MSIFDCLKTIVTDFGASHRRKVAALTVLEAEELQNIFALLLLGSFVGIPSPPTFLAVELLPFMQEELRLLDDRAQNSHDMLAEMCAMLGID